jgi:hypothetical protein
MIPATRAPQRNQKSFTSTRLTSPLISPSSTTHAHRHNVSRRHPHLLFGLRQPHGPITRQRQASLRALPGSRSRYLFPVAAPIHIRILTNPLIDSSTQTTTTTSQPSSFPSSLRLKLSAVQTIAAEDLHTEAKISQTCPECNHPEMWFYTLQLRSADEGVSIPGGTIGEVGLTCGAGRLLFSIGAESVDIGSIPITRRVQKRSSKLGRYLCLF